MGTRSILAVELPSGEYHCQYLQFDGSPTGVGEEYYGEVVQRMCGAPSVFFPPHPGEEGLLYPPSLIDSTLEPAAFSNLVLAFLNWAQYRGHHSVGHHWTISPSEWKSQKVWQEWQYLFDRQGNFHIWDTRAGEYTIPIEATRALVAAPHSQTRRLLGESAFGPGIEMALWKAMEDAKYPKDHEEFPSIEEISPVLVTGEVHAFPDQGERGWRSFLQYKERGEVLVGSEFLEGRFQGNSRRNEREIPFLVRNPLEAEPRT